MLEAHDITVEIQGRTIIENISFALPDGELFALIGANGAGKTTLIRTLNGNSSPSRGDCSLDGKNVRHMSRREVATAIAVVAQETETRFPITVEEFVRSGRFANGGTFGWEGPADREAGRAAILACDLASYENRLMNGLSGGERQRVVLARAFATEAKVLLLDEPTANLDLKHQQMMFRLVRDRCVSKGASAIVITHDLNLAAAYADSVLVLDAGRLIAHGSPDSVLTAGMIEQAFDVDVLIDRHPTTGRVRVTND